MKTLLLLVATVSMLAVGCTESPTDPVPGYYVSSRVNGSSFDADRMSATTTSDMIIISAQTSDGKRLELMLRDTHIDQFDLGSDSYNQAVLQVGPNPAQRYVAKYKVGEGRVVISRRIPSEMTGTFAFTGKNANGESLKVERGSFRVRLMQ